MENIKRQCLIVAFLIISYICFFVFVVWSYLYCSKTQPFYLLQNKTTLEIYKIYQKIDAVGYIKCHEFSNINSTNPNCGKTICECVQNSMNVFLKIIV